MNLDNVKLEISNLEHKIDAEELTNDCEKIIALIHSIPDNQWDYEIKMAYARALNCLSTSDGFDTAYNVLIETADKGQDDYDWHCCMASVCFNMQMYDKAVQYARSALKIDKADDCAKEMLELFSQFT